MTRTGVDVGTRSYPISVRTAFRTMSNATVRHRNHGSWSSEMPPRSRCEMVSPIWPRFSMFIYARSREALDRIPSAQPMAAVLRQMIACAPRDAMIRHSDQDTHHISRTSRSCARRTASASQSNPLWIVIMTPERSRA